MSGTLSCGGKIEVLTPEEERVRLREDLTDDFCIDGSWSKVQGLNPAAPQDYIALRHMHSSLEDAEAYLADYLPTEEHLAELTPEGREEQLDLYYSELITTSQEVGTCQPAAGCSRNVLPPELGFSDGGVHSFHFLAYGAGTTTFITRAEQLPAFLGEIDTPQEAALLVFARDKFYRIKCNEKNYSARRGGYEIYSESGTCGGDVTGHLIFVSETGEITIESSAVVQEGEGSCPYQRHSAETE